MRGASAPRSIGGTAVRRVSRRGRRLPDRDRPRRLARPRRGDRHRRLRPAARARRSPRRLPAGVLQVAARGLPQPGDLPEGGVLVVGASATGLQLAEEIQRSGRPVTLAAGRHTADAAPLPRPRHLRAGSTRPASSTRTARSGCPTSPPPARQPSMQLVRARAARPRRGSPPLGVRVVGRVAGVADGARLALRRNLAADCAASDARLRRAARAHRRLDRRGRHSPRRRTRGPGAAAAASGDRRAGARPRRRGHPQRGLGHRLPAATTRWLRVPVLDARRRDRATRAASRAAPGLYVLGLRFLRRRSSNFIDGVGRDAEALAAEVAASPRAAPRSPPDGRPHALRPPLRRDRRRRPRRRRRDRAAARPRRRARAGRRARRRRAPTRSRPTR